MARMTATDLVSLTRRRMGNPSTDEWSDTDMLRFIHLATMRVATAHQCATLETYTDITTESDTAEYEFSVSNILKINAARNITDGLRLKTGSRADYTKDTQTTTTQTGVIQRYIESGLGSNGRKQVLFHLTPDGIKTIRFWYTKIPAEVVLEPVATSPETPQEFDETVLDFAAEIGMKNDQQMREAAAARQLASDPEGRAASAKPDSPERFWPQESPIAPSTKVRR